MRANGITRKKTHNILTIKLHNIRPHTLVRKLRPTVYSINSASEIVSGKVEIIEKHNNIINTYNTVVEYTKAKKKCYIFLGDNNII